MKFHPMIPFFMLIAALGCSGGKKNTAGIPAVSGFNPQRYMGTWYEIARFPHVFEKGMSHVTAEYTLKDDGTIQVVNRGRREDGSASEIKGKAKIASSKGEGELKVSFFGPFYSPYRIIYLNENYTVAVVTSSTKDYLWILGREKVLLPDQKETCLKLMRDNGFEVEKLQWVKHVM